jgi:hypothetical protein
LVTSSKSFREIGFLSTKRYFAAATAFFKSINEVVPFTFRVIPAARDVGGETALGILGWETLKKLKCQWEMV